MAALIIERHDLNPERLQDDLRELLGDDLIGISTRPGQIIVHLRDGTSAAQHDQARTAVRQHDAASPSAAQQQRQQRNERLARLRNQHANSIDLDTYPRADPLLRALAERIVWLEAEIAALRDA